jgi:hypothetical protein
VADVAATWLHLLVRIGKSDGGEGGLTATDRVSEDKSTLSGFPEKAIETLKAITAIRSRILEHMSDPPARHREESGEQAPPKEAEQSDE